MGTWVLKSTEKKRHRRETRNVYAVFCLTFLLFTFSRGTQLHKIVKQGPCSAPFSVSLFILVLFALVSFCRAAQKSANFFALSLLYFHSMMECQTSFFYLCLLGACKPLMSHFSSSSTFFSSGAIDWVRLPSNLAFAVYGACCKLWSFYNPWEATLAGFLCAFIWRCLYILVCRRARPRIF